MGILMTIIIGFIVGLVARFIKPGRDNMGFILTTVVGILGALIAGYLGQALGLYTVGEPAGFLASVLGAVIILTVVKAVTARRV
ncbi:MAG: GlsB/YeaQ/YmgE family stress response membrane protein [Bdellovibrionota bacterium]